MNKLFIIDTLGVLICISFVLTTKQERFRNTFQNMNCNSIAEVNAAPKRKQLHLDCVKHLIMFNDDLIFVVIRIFVNMNMFIRLVGFWWYGYAITSRINATRSRLYAIGFWE